MVPLLSECDLQIAYKVYPDKHGPSGSFLYCAMLGVQAALPNLNAPRTKRFEAVIDSGATRTLLHSDIAAHLGLNIKTGQLETTQGISGSESVYLHEIMLYLPGGPIKAKVGFKENLPIAGLLGMNGFFEFFKVTFNPESKICEIQRIYHA
jgi:hypothetical protein